MADVLPYAISHPLSAIYQQRVGLAGRRRAAGQQDWSGGRQGGRLPHLSSLPFAFPVHGGHRL